MYLTNSTTPYMYSRTRLDRGPDFDSVYTRSPSFDSAAGTLPSRRYAVTSSLVRPLPVGPGPLDSNDRPLHTSPSTSSFLNGTSSLNTRNYPFTSSKPPLPSSFSSTTSPSSYGSSGSSRYSSTIGSYGRYPRSLSNDRTLDSLSSSSRLSDGADLVGHGTQVHHITRKYERLMDNGDRDYGGGSRNNRVSTLRTHLTNGVHAASDDEESPRHVVYSSYVGRKASFGSSEEESRDALTSLPRGESNGYRFYRSESGATSLPDVPSLSLSNQSEGDCSPTIRYHKINVETTTPAAFSRGEQIRSSSSSVESSASRTSSASSGRGREAARTEEQTNSRAGLVGLQNLGNTCFMNSVLQCLSQTRPLREFCVREWQHDINATNSRMKGALMKAFSELLSQLWNPTRATYVTPDHFKAQVQRFAPRFVGYSQQDAQEFLRYVLQGLHEDVNRVRGRTSPLAPLDDNLPDEQKAQESWKRYLRIDDSRIVDIFVGQLKSELKCCHCGHVSSTFDPFWDLSLPIPQERRMSEVSIYDCLDAFTREELLDGDEKPKCERCKTHRKSTKRFTMHRFPQILVLHLKRFSGERYRSRMSTLVDFPINELDMKKYASSKNTDACYSLYAVSNHTGTPMMGHYTAYCDHANTNRWHLYDDTRVSSAPERSVVSSEAYVLFYQLISPEASRL